MNKRSARGGVRLVSETKDSMVPSAVIKTPRSSLRTGAVVQGKYVVGKLIGEGGVGLVYEAQNLELDERVALKCLRPEMLVDTSMVARFAREAKAASLIKSEYVATVFDVGMTPDGEPFMLMEYLEGRDLNQVVEQDGVLGPRVSTEYALQACEALAVAHAKGIVHRDIKPGNMMLTERSGGIPIIKVLDFGISKAALTGSVFRNDLPLVKSVNLVGTPLYMSPEQIRDADSCDARSDIWSLGMVLYELLTGTTAFEAQNLTELCAAVLETAARPIDALRKDLPSGLVDVIHKCLERNPSDRYQTVAELAVALMPFGPKRARINVERAVAVLQASGMVDASLRVLSTMPPSSGTYIDSIVVPASPRLPSIGSIAAADPVPGDSAVRASTPSTVVASAPLRDPSSTAVSIDAEVASMRRSRMPLVLALLLAVGLVAGGVYVMHRRDDATARAAAEPARSTVTTVAPEPALPVVAATTATAMATERVTATTTATAGGTTAATGPAAPLVPNRPPPWAPAGRPVPNRGGPPPKATVSAKEPVPEAVAPTAPARSAPRSSDEPDLGY